MRSSTIIFVTTALLASASAFAQPAVQISPSDPSRFAFRAPVSAFSYYPGNSGDYIFRQDTTTSPLRWREELLCDAHLLELDRPDYDFRPTAHDSESTSPPMYWLRLQSVLGGATSTGTGIELRVTQPLLDALQASGNNAADTFARRLAERTRTTQIPLISFDTHWSPTAALLHSALKTHMPDALTGRVQHSISSIAAGPSPDFYVFHVDSALAETANQHLVSQCRAVAGNLPIILSLEKPNFNAQLFWLAAGAAGFQYASLPAESTIETSEWRNVRSLAAFKARIPLNGLQVFPQWAGRDFYFCIGTPGEFYCAAPMNKWTELPRFSTYPEFVQVWYNPRTDENIMAPRVPYSVNAKLEKPSSDDWLYCYYPRPQSTDADTTTPAPVIDPDLMVPAD